MNHQAVGISAHGPLAPSFRVRLAVPSTALSAHGVDLALWPLLTAHDAAAFASAPIPRKALVLAQSRRRMAGRLASAAFETVVVQRRVDPLPTSTLERQAIKGRRLVLDVDDAIWLDTSAGAGGSRLAWLKASRRKVAWLASRADQVIAGNDILASWLERYNGAVEVVPSLVDTASVGVRRHENTDHPIVLGWIGSPTTAPYLERITTALERVARRPSAQRFELQVMGGRAPKLRAMPVRELAWTETAERELLARMDIGLMPLRDSAWARGKCAYKALQYMSAGIPVIADDVGISASVIGDDRAGVIARSQDDWVEAVLALAADASLRRRLGADGRRRVEQDFSVERWSPVLAALLRGRDVPEAPAAGARDRAPGVLGA